jgi:3D (Asp-Asp-Asp) domain-containing protein
VYSSGQHKGERKAVGITSSGTCARPGTIAADLSRYPYGTVIYVEGYGFGQVEDCGSDIKGDHVDLFFNSHRTAEAWGRKLIKARIWMPYGVATNRNNKAVKTQ